MSSMTGIIFLQFVMRRVFSNSLVWSEELARYMFIWLIYIGISYGAKLKRHIKVEVLVNALPPKMQPYLLMLGEIIFLGFAVYIIFSSHGIVMRQVALGQTSPALGIPMSVVYAAPMVGFFLTSFRQIQVLKDCAVDLWGSKGSESCG
jgi:TRAP-type C4-dicarboxylate transport system permease small subunit